MGLGFKPAPKPERPAQGKPDGQPGSRGPGKPQGGKPGAHGSAHRGDQRKGERPRKRRPRARRPAQEAGGGAPGRQAAVARGHRPGQGLRDPRPAREGRAHRGRGRQAGRSTPASRGPRQADRAGQGQGAQRPGRRDRPPLPVWRQDQAHLRQREPSSRRSTPANWACCRWTAATCWSAADVLAQAEAIFAAAIALKVDPNAPAGDDPYADPQVPGA